MTEEPIFPGWVKALIALLVIAVAAVIAAPSIDDIDIDLDQLTSTGEDTVEINPGEGITVDPSEPGPSMLTSAGLREALAAVKADVGETPQLTRLQLSEPFADFHILRGDELGGRRFSSFDHGLTELEVEFIGSDPIELIAYPIARVSVAAPDRILAGLREAVGAADLDLISLDLRRDPVSNVLRWEVVITRPGIGGEVYYALPDGSRAGRVDSSAEPIAG
jgi:hypothetical protein